MASIADRSSADPIYRRTGHGDGAVLFIHGFLDAGSVWDDVVSRLEDRNVERIQIDLPGMGDRSGDDGPYTLDRFAAEVGAVLNHIGKPVLVVGQSMGAQVAELVAAAAPRQVAGLVLLTPIPLGGMNLPDEAIAPFQSLGANAAGQRALRRQLCVDLDDQRLERLGTIGDRVKPAVVAALASAWNRGHPDGRRASAYQGPVLIVRGEHDPLVTQQMIETAVAPRFTDANTATMYSAGHWPHVEHAQAFAKVLREFLDTLPQSTARSVQPQSWTRTFDRASADAFAQELAPDVALEATALTRPVHGRDRVRIIIAAGRQIYESMAFTHEAANGARHYLEWGATAFGGRRLAGVTVLTRNDEGKIVRVAIHHRPLDVALRFSAELGLRLRENESIDAELFHRPLGRARD